MALFKIYSPDQKSFVGIDKGELISYIKDGEELIHQKGEPGWRNSDTEMFPVIGPTESNGFKVNTPRGDAIQDQHGLLRELNYELAVKGENSIVFHKKYEQNTPIKNSKYPEKSTEELVAWPYSFSFSKKFRLSDNELIVEFEVEGEKDMPFMLGYHPAFKLSGNNSEKIKVKGEELELQKILDVGSIAYPALNVDELILVKKEGYHLELKTKGFNNFMLWTEVPEMICLEPITAYPYTGEESLSNDLFMTSKGNQVFQVFIRPFR